MYSRITRHIKNKLYVVDASFQLGVRNECIAVSHDTIKNEQYVVDASWLIRSYFEYLVKTSILIASF